MFWVDLLFVLLFALALGSILSWGFGWQRPGRTSGAGASFLFLFLILLFAMWAGAGWLRPWGPTAYGTPWLGLLLVGLFVSLLILAITPPANKPWTPSEARAEAREEAEMAKAYGTVFWILIVALVIVAIIGYFV